MAQQPGLIEYAVPEGFPAMSRPCQQETRFKHSDIKLRLMEEKDLSAIVAGIYEAFPEVWWSNHESPKTRPSNEIRQARFAKRISPLVHQPGFHGVVATIAQTGEFVGFAGWHAPRYGKAPLLPETSKVPEPNYPAGFQPGMMMARAPHHQLDFAQRAGWTPEEEAEMWEHVGPSYGMEFRKYDDGRLREMKGEPHWYLAPLFVNEKTRGRGVGSMLMNYALKRADEADPPVAVVLESFPNAVPVYRHLEFEERSANGPGKDTLHVRPARKA